MAKRMDIRKDEIAEAIRNAIQMCWSENLFAQGNLPFSDTRIKPVVEAVADEVWDVLQRHSKDGRLRLNEGDQC